MSVQRKSVPAGEADLESTAELPVLDVAAFEAGSSEERVSSTDTWVIPASAAAAMASAVVDEQRTHIEADLRALSANLREVEERLTRKGQRLIEIENELADSRAERAAVETRAGALAAELAESRERATAAEAQAAAARGELEARITGLQRDAEAQATQFRAQLDAQSAESLRAIESRDAAANQQQARIQEIAGQLAARDRALAAASGEARGLEARMAGYLEVLHSLEGRRGVFLGELSGLDEALEERDARLAEVERELQARAQQARDLASELQSREHRVATLERELNAVATALAQRNEQLEHSERSRLKLHAAVAELTEALSVRSERVSALETATAQQSESFSAHVHEIQRLRQERDEAQSTAARLGSALDEAKSLIEQQSAAAKAAEAEREEFDRVAAETHTGLEASLQSTKHNVNELTGELAGARRQLEERTAALRAALDERTAALTAQLGQQESALRAQLQEREGFLQAQIDERDARLADQLAESHTALQAANSQAESRLQQLTAAEDRTRQLEGDLAEQIEASRALREELRSIHERKQEIEGDLRAAEDTLNRVETELRAKSAKVDELLKTSEEWRSVVEEARQSLAQRDSFISRLESEAAQSAMLLGNIQQSIKRLDPNANSGNHEIVPEGAVRLLIRSEGDVEVVHVLSRKTTIGRTSDNDLQINTKFISRHHAVILAGPNYTIVEDLNSTNGVLVNNRRVNRHTLQDGDAVTIGRTQFRFAVRPTRAS